MSPFLRMATASATTFKHSAASSKLGNAGHRKLPRTRHSKMTQRSKLARTGGQVSKPLSKHVGPPHSRTKIYAARVSSSSYQSISAACARPQQQTRWPPLLLSIDGTARRTDGRICDVLRRLPHAIIIIMDLRLVFNSAITRRLDNAASAELSGGLSVAAETTLNARARSVGCGL